MDIPMLYALAEKENIGILRFPLPNTGSMSVMDEGGRCSIGMDPGVLDGGALERVHLGHELGHCVTGSFYSRSTAVAMPQKHLFRLISASGKRMAWMVCVTMPVAFM